MNKTIPTSKAKGSWKSLLPVPRQDQEGMALVLALLLGMVMKGTGRERRQQWCSGD